ncbi:hypothetical protein F8M41_017509 [Gigaspora margarita]|uniref:Uncharacterized protein n=1 Tax=Gigaspora margarita TaxID=4874 RepID=A0A8H4AMY1_GIGMA|nr:hypothetical protein F8M41_017509 [Gigaspora margarita]
MAKNTMKINTLELEFENKYHEDEKEFFHTLIWIIKSQDQLKQFGLIGGEKCPTKFYGIISALESQKSSLQEVIIDYCAFSTEFEVLKNCKNLEILHIRYCDYMIPLKILDYNKINTLEVVDCPIDSKDIALILEKFGISLQRLKLVSDDKIQEESLLLEVLKSFCPNITYLNISNIEFSTQLLEFIGNLQKLQFLTLSSLWCIVDDISEEELKKRAYFVSTIANVIKLAKL